jgi:hypothetical protein
VRESSRPLAPRSRALLALDFRDGPLWEPSTGLLVARSGQRFSVSRGSATLASVNATGGTYTAPASMPAWELANGVLGLRQGVDDVVRETADIACAVQAFSGELEIVERGARSGTAGGTLLALSADDPTSGVRFYLDTTGSLYRLTAHNGTTSAAVTLGSGAPAPGDLVRFRFDWTGTALTLTQSINGGAAVTATGAGVALPSAWGAIRWRIGRRGATANPAALTLLRLLVVPGALNTTTLDEGY